MSQAQTMMHKRIRDANCVRLTARTTIATNGVDTADPIPRPTAGCCHLANLMACHILPTYSLKISQRAVADFA